MKFPVILLGAALYLFSSVEADINTKTPFKSITWNGGDDEKIEWNDDGKAPGLDELAKSGLTTIELMAGGPNNQVPVKTIGKVLATKGEIDFDVPKDVGPPGDFYFIRYTTGKSTSFSGSFTISGVNGKIAGFDPKTPNAKTAEPNAGNVTAPATPGTPGTPPTNPYTAPAPTTPKTDPKAINSPASSPTVPAAPAPTTDLPNSLSNSAAYNFPSFAGVATAAVAFAFTYLY